jgi:hypothetical protein
MLTYKKGVIDEKANDEEVDE